MSKRKKTTTIEEEVKKELRREAKSERNMLLDLFRQGHHKQLLPAEAIKMKRMLKGVHGGLHLGYIKTLLFPEQFSYDIPMPLSSISYSKFTDKQETNLATLDGSGMLVWYPRTNCGPQLFYLPGNATYTDAQGLNAKQVAIPTAGQGVSTSAIYNINKLVDGQYSKSPVWQWGLPMYAYQHFSQTALVGASISIQYIGRVELEAGLMVGGHLHGIPLENINTEEIENSQWVTRARPGEGLRFIFLPKDQSDFEFYPATPGSAYNQGANPQPLQGSNQANAVSATLLQMPINNDKIAANAGATKFTVPLISPSKAWDKDYSIIKNTEVTGLQDCTSIDYVKNASCIAIYFQGLEAAATGSVSFRIDITRRFIGMPLGKTRDIVDLTRPDKTYDVQKTFNAVSMISNSSPIGGHTLKEIDKVVDPLIDTLPNISYLVDNGGLSTSKTLDQLVQQLQDPMNRDKNLEGQFVGIPVHTIPHPQKQLYTVSQKVVVTFSPTTVGNFAKVNQLSPVSIQVCSVHSIYISHVSVTGELGSHSNVGDFRPSYDSVELSGNRPGYHMSVLQPFYSACNSSVCMPPPR